MPPLHTPVTASPSSYTTSYFELRRHATCYAEVVCVHTCVYVRMYVSIVAFAIVTMRSNTCIQHGTNTCTKTHANCTIQAARNRIMHSRRLTTIATSQHSRRGPLLAHMLALHTRSRGQYRALQHLWHVVLALVRGQRCFAQSVETRQKHLGFASCLSASYRRKIWVLRGLCDCVVGSNALLCFFYT